MFKFIIWDFDGTLHDTYPGMVQAFENGLKELGIEEDTVKVFNEIKVSVGHAVRFFAGEYGLEAKDVRDMYVKYSKKLPSSIMAPYPNALKVCKSFKETGGQNFVYTHRDDATLKYLEYHNMLEYFEDVITSVHGFKKPNPDGFLHIIEKHNLNSKEGLGVGDRDLDIIAAQRAGMKACLIDNDGLPYESEPEFVVDDILELVRILGLEG
ncbi:MAG: HAD-IA family hydrolase [Clostridiales bacterium]|nr:HAD-IA family hydrolase [Clostridiales bacterium]